MKQFAKYLCAIVVLVGMSVNAWGAIYIEYDGNKYYNGTTITINVDLVSAWASSVDAMTIKNDGDGWSSSTYYRGHIHATISGSYVYSNIAFGMAGVEGNNGTPYWEDDEHYTSFYEWNNWQYETLSFYTSYAFDAAGTYNSTITVVQKDDNDASTLQSATITVSYVVTAACTPNDVVYDHSGTGGDDPTGDDAACEDATVTFTPDPSSGYAYSGATVYESSDLENAYATLDANTTSFTMPDEDVYVVATYAPINYTISFNANGGSGSMDNVVRAYNATYNLPACGFTAPSGKVFDGWAEGSAGGTERAVGYSHMVAGDITFYAKWRDAVISDYVFSCADLTLTPHLVTAGTPVFITSAANKKVRSQDYITITGSGLTPNTPLTFPGLPSKFEVLTATGGTISTDASGAIDDVNAYIFYTPAADATADGLDQLAGLTVSVGGAKPKQVSIVQPIIGRHLPSQFVIAGKKDNKWYALPATMETGSTPTPVEIAVDNINNPSIAYTAETNIYGLEGPVAANISGGNGQYVRLTMSQLTDGTGAAGPAPLYASTSANIGKNGTASATSDLSAGFWWALTQKNTGITNAQDAKYNIKSPNNSNTLSIKNTFQWGLYASGVEELRLIPASDITFTEAYFVEWAQHGGVVEVDAQGIAATSVIAHLGEATSSATLIQTGTSVNGSATKYNYTVNFGEGIDFAAAASNGAMLTLEWKNGETVKAMSNIVVPKIVASNITANYDNYPLKTYWETEVHVLPGDTLTIDASGYPKKVITISELNIYPGATVKVVGTNDTLNVRSLVLRNGWTRATAKRYDVARLYISTSSYLKKANNTDGWYSDWYIDFDQYYPVAVPWKVTVAEMSYKNTKQTAAAGVKLRYYDGQSRAANVQEGVGSSVNWKLYGEDGNKSLPTYLEPGKGYAMTAKRPGGKAFSIVRMPLTYSNEWGALGEKGVVGENHKDTVHVKAWDSGSTPSYAQGWNLIANPYMSVYKGALSYAEEDNVRYANIPNITFTEYDQVLISSNKLKPSSAFLIQAPKDGALTFGEGNRQAAAPSIRNKKQDEKIPVQEAYIVLHNDEADDMMGILIGEDYTEAYELNADLQKQLGNESSLRTYMKFADLNMAYLAINEMLAKSWIPVDVRIPANGEYTFSMANVSKVDRLKGVYLIDYANGDKITNLLEESYLFEAEAGTISGRFAINAIFGERPVPTDIDVVGGDVNGSEPIKFLYHDKVFILHNGVIYDATGKKVKEINK